MRNIKFTIGIPFYNNEKFIDFFVSWLNENKSEKRKIYEIIIINDNPDSQNKSYLKNVAKKYHYLFIDNKVNQGFLLNANLILEKAKKNNTHAIILNSDTLPHGNIISEFSEIFKNNNIGILAPRSNNATICNISNKTIPINHSDKHKIEKIKNDFEIFKKHVNQYDMTSVVNGFCFVVSIDVINALGFFDTNFCPAYFEENDYCIRASNLGFRIGIANRAFVVHFGSISYGVNSSVYKKNQIKFYKKYPDFDKYVSSNINHNHIHRVFSYASNNILHKNDFLIDASSLSDIKNGTNFLITQLISELSSRNFKINVIVNINNAKKHKINKLKNIRLINSDEFHKFIKNNNFLYKFGIRIGQPFMKSHFDITHFSLHSTCIFFDSIATDCYSLFQDNEMTILLWHKIYKYFDHINFISNDSMMRFKDRYSYSKDNLLTATLLPIFTKKKLFSANKRVIESKYIVVIGNKFSHKGLEVVHTLPTITDTSYFVYSKIKTNREDVLFSESGFINDDHHNNILGNSEFIIFPSFSEGFGYPILDAIQHRKLIYCRTLNSILEIYKNLPNQFKKYIVFTNDFKSLKPISKSELNSKLKNTFDTRRFRNYKEYVSNLLHVINTNFNKSYENIAIKGFNENKLDTYKFSYYFLRFASFFLQTKLGNLTKVFLIKIKMYKKIIFFLRFILSIRVKIIFDEKLF